VESLITLNKTYQDCYLAKAYSTVELVTAKQDCVAQHGPGAPGNVPTKLVLYIRRPTEQQNLMK